MLTVDLVRARRRGDRLLITKLSRDAKAEAFGIAERYIRLAAAHVGETREVFDQSCRTVAVEGRHRRMAAGLLKLVVDRCNFESAPNVDPREVRAFVFCRAHQERLESAEGTFDRAMVLQQAAKKYETTEEEVARLLYADLKSAQRLISFRSWDVESLLAHYEFSNAQAVLLRATRIEVQFECGDPLALRHLFAKLKFLQLLFSLHQESPGRYRLLVDGPLSLFRASTKYGLKLALLLPVLDAVDRWELRAEVRWGKARQQLSFELAGRRRRGSTRPTVQSELPAAAQELMEKFRQRDGPWYAQPASRVLDLPGVGLCVPDLCFVHRDTEEAIHLELLGHWSRDAVWKRVMLVEKGLTDRVLFAASDRLRVSEAVLDAQQTASLYVYKGVVHAGAIERKLDELAATKAT